MKIYVGMDGDGHFIGAQLLNRLEVINVMKNVQDGECWDNRENCDEFPEETDWMNLNDESWLRFVNENTGRNFAEIIEIK